MKLLVGALVLVSTFAASHATLAQTDPLESGRQAFDAGRYQEAAELFEQAAANHPDLAEAHYWMARVYMERPLNDEGRARHVLEKALELEPENVDYLELRMALYRSESWHFLGNRIREARRLETARRLLEVDPENALAHEQLGMEAVQEFWRYRNVVVMPNLDSSEPGVVRDIGGQSPGSGDHLSEGSRFDIETLKSLGVDVINLSRRGHRAYLRAIEHFSSALESDSSLRSVYDEVMRILALKDAYEEAIPMLQEMNEVFPEDADVWRYAGLARYKLGHLAQAERAFSMALQYMTEEDRAAYTELGLFLTSEEQTLEATDPGAFRERYWASQDPRFLTPHNERHLEHYFRLTYADLLYGAPRRNLRGWQTERGQILIRYGLPETEVNVHPHEDGVFTAREAEVGGIASGIGGSSGGSGATSQRTVSVSGTQGFGAVLSTARQAFEQLNAYDIWDYGDFRFVFEDPFRSGEYRLYSPPADEVAQRVNSFLDDYVLIAKEIARETPQRFEYQPPGRLIALPYLVTAFKGKGPETDLYVQYGVPVGNVNRAAREIGIAGKTGAFLVGPERNILVQKRRSFMSMPTDQVLSFAVQNLWVDTHTLQAPPGNHELSVEFESASGQTVALQRRPITVPEFDTDALALSDIMLAYSVEETGDGTPLATNEIVRDGLSIMPAPWSVYAPEWPIYLYFEVYGLSLADQGSTDYTVEISLGPKETRTGVKRVLGGLLRRREDGVSVSYHGSGTQPDESLYQILDASQQELGLYTIRLRVRDNVTGKRTESTQDLLLER